MPTIPKKIGPTIPMNRSDTKATASISTLVFKSADKRLQFCYTNLPITVFHIQVISILGYMQQQYHK